MKDKSTLYDVVLKVKIDLKGNVSLEGKLENLTATGEWIKVSSKETVKVGDDVTLDIPIPSQIHKIQCKGHVVDCQKHNDSYDIEIHIKDIDEKAKNDIRKFCDFLIPSVKIDTVTYLIHQGENALEEALESSVKEPSSEEMQAVINELLSLKYHDALRSFENALKLDKENEIAIEGFCYSLANTIVHYERAGLTGLAETIKIKAMQYVTKKTPEIAKKSPRISRYLMEAIKDVLDTVN